MLKSYFKIAFRNFRKHKAYSFINILGLAIGIACGLLIILFIQDEVKYDRFHEKGDRIVRTAITYTRPNGDKMSMPIMPYRLKPALETAFPEIESIVRIRPWDTMVRYDDKEFSEQNMAFADEEFFNVFSFDLIAGDPNTVLKDPFSMVITEAVGKKYFGDESPIGKTLRVNHFSGEQEYKISGLLAEMPQHSHFHFDMLMSMNAGPQLFRDIVLQNWGEGSNYSYLLLPEGYDYKQLEARLPDFGTENIDEMFNQYGEFFLQPLTDIHLKSQLRGEIEPNGDILYVYIFAAVALFILLIASINYMNLATARSANRAKEVGMRKVLGAFRQQLVTQFLGEAVLLTFIALVLAAGLAFAFLPVFNELSGKELSLNLAENWQLFSGFALLSLIIGIFAGSYPAFFLSAFRPVSVLKGGTKIKSSNSWLRRGLVVLQFGISIVLIICTLVVYNQLDYLQNKKLGIEPEQIVIALDPGRELYQTYKTEALKNPRVISISASNKRPTRRLSSNLGYKAEGLDPETPTSIKAVTVDFDFFETLGIDIVEGRSFSKEYGSDLAEGFILNEAAVKEIGWENPIGKWFETRTVTEDFQWTEKRGVVVGVASNIHFESLHHEIQPTVYFLEPNWMNWMSIKISSENMPATIDFLKATWDKLDPGFPFNSTFLDDDIQALYNNEARFLDIFVHFASLAIFIACLGIFGLASFTAEQRTREIGIRKTLGASVPNIIRLMSGEFTKLVLFANIIAWPVAYFYMNEWLVTFPYHTAWGITAFILGPAILSALLAFVIAALSVSFQAVKAALTNPVKALRYE